ncbi:FxsA family protein [Effusibacillus dendaii]|uniref:Membrane protein FxsA n=1 Tax=Effusibacillus dendaii TaxID=2743772 RepID=A0A7I8DD47_9BACL|nr:FxsA family protein [Effusibacillus dendaii]BCJ88025.1 hypothetical protein skT53_30100 [Effusibacillus dendaii]
MFRLLFLLFVIVPTIEIFVLIQVGKAIGGWQTVFLILLTAVLGAYLAKSQGRATLRRLQIEMASGQPPGNTLLDGICILAGGVLLLMPGFVTDLMGVVLLFPVTRQPIKRWLRRWLGAQFEKGTWVSYRRF